MTEPTPVDPDAFDDAFDDALADELDDDLLEYSEQEQAIIALFTGRLDHGPTTVDEIVDAVWAAGIFQRTEDPDDPDNPTDDSELAGLVEELILDTEGLWDHGGRVDRIERMLDGKVLTHRITADELAAGELVLGVDLCIGQFTLPRQLDPEGRAGLRIPPEQLRGIAADELVGLRWRGAELALERIGDPRPGTAERLGVLASLQRALDAGWADTLHAHVMNAIVTNPDLFRQPTLPLSELMEEAGLIREDDHFGPADRVWRKAGHGDAIHRAESSFNLDACCVDALRLVDLRWRADHQDKLHLPEVPSDAEVIEALAHGDVAPAFAEGADRPGDADRLRAYARALLDQASPTDLGPRLLAACVADRYGELDEAERLYHDVLTLDDGTPAAIEGLALMAYERSDFPAANRLFRLIYEPTHHYVEVTDELASRLVTAGRNDRCPCGSGRKYKVCHADQTLTDPEQRVEIVLHKLANFVTARSQRLRLATTALDADLDPELILTNRFLFECYLLDPAHLDAYRALRGPLLPADEAALLDRMAELPLQLVEVVETRPPSTIVLRDLVTGDHTDWDVPLGPDLLAAGQIGFVRLLDGHLVGRFTLMGTERRPELAALMADGSPTLTRILRWFVADGGISRPAEG